MGPQESQDSQTAPQQPQQFAQPMAPPQPPQQFVQPAAFPQQVQPIQPGIPPTPAPKKGLSKGALWGIIGGGVGLLVIIVGVVLGVVLLGGPSKDDYQKANNTLNDAKTAYNDISGLSYISSYSVTDTTIKNDLEKIKSAKSKVDTAVEQIGSMKAVRNKDVKESYDKLKARMGNFDTMMNTSIEVYEKIMPVMVKLNDATSSSATSESVLASLTDVRKSLQALDLNAEANKTYVDGLVEQIKILETVIPKKIAMNSDYTKYDASVSEQYYDAIDKLNDLDKDWSSNLEKVTSNGEIRTQLTDLGDVLYNKYLGIK